MVCFCWLLWVIKTIKQPQLLFPEVARTVFWTRTTMATSMTWQGQLAQRITGSAHLRSGDRDQSWCQFTGTPTIIETFNDGFIIVIWWFHGAYHDSHCTWWAWPSHSVLSTYVSNIVIPRHCNNKKWYQVKIHIAARNQPSNLLGWSSHPKPAGSRTSRTTMNLWLISGYNCYYEQPQVIRTGVYWYSL